MLKKLLQHIGEYKTDIVLTPIFVILEVVMQINLLNIYLMDMTPCLQAMGLTCLKGKDNFL